MKPEELHSIASFMFSNNQTSKISKFIEGILKDFGYGSFVDLMHEHKYRLKFLKKISSKLTLKITRHARERTSSYLEKDLNDKEMKGLLLKGLSIPYSDMLALGFRSNERYKENSIYVSIGNGLYAILEEESPTFLIWITTLTQKRTPSSRVPLTQEEYESIIKRKP